MKWKNEYGEAEQVVFEDGETDWVKGDLAFSMAGSMGLW